MRLVFVSLGLIACTAPDADGFRRLPGSWAVERVITGDAARGFGAAVAVDAGGDVLVGAPWQGPGRVHRGSEIVLEGVDGDFLGSALVGGEALLVGAPGRAAVVDAQGAALLEGEADSWVGGAVVRHAGGVAAVGRSGVFGAGGFEVGERVWSLAAVRLDGRTTDLVAGLASGGVAWATDRRVASGAIGRGLLACDVDLDGDDDLVVADPLAGTVAVFVLDELSALDLSAPTRRHDLGAGAGRSLACVRGGVLVGAPEQSPAGIAWIRRPLEATDVRWLSAAASPSSLGFSIAVGGGRAVVGDPERGEVLVLKPRRRR